MLLWGPTQFTKIHLCLTSLSINCFRSNLNPTSVFSLLSPQLYPSPSLRPPYHGGNHQAAASHSLSEIVFFTIVIVRGRRRRHPANPERKRFFRRVLVGVEKAVVPGGPGHLHLRLSVLSRRHHPSLRRPRRNHRARRRLGGELCHRRIFFWFAGKVD